MYPVCRVKTIMRDGTGLVECVSRMDVGWRYRDNHNRNLTRNT